jgi:catechol 2,3-dioxygenase-like lactoylglutathione lyase family enzyme
MAVIRYLVHDVEIALSFYSALGFSLVDRWGPPFAILRKDDLELWLSGPGTSAQKKLSDGTQPEPGGWGRMVMEVTDIKASLEALMLVDAEVRSSPTPGPAGIHALVQDPSGNLIEIFEPTR